MSLFSSDFHIRVNAFLGPCLVAWIVFICFCFFSWIFIGLFAIFVQILLFCRWIYGFRGHLAWKSQLGIWDFVSYVMIFFLSLDLEARSKGLQFSFYFPWVFYLLIRFHCAWFCCILHRLNGWEGLFLGDQDLHLLSIGFWVKILNGIWLISLLVAHVFFLYLLKLARFWKKLVYWWPSFWFVNKWWVD